ncbi:hypothetical protein [Anatilimnocola floriformis]|uniref:hypothetical protein n=1 Tax=Anatilimnocola floriformis TaxID=2948575 RepID=UPI0020C500EB|nr:hypothetical protein [Anatilimnocola floriformis]
MAKKKSANKVNKSELIRAYIAEFPDKSPKEVADFITAQGYPVSPQFVSTTKSNAKKKAGKKPGKRGPKPKLASIAPLGGSIVDNGLVAIESAGSLLTACGSLEAARKTLEAIAKIMGQRTGNG